MNIARACFDGRVSEIDKQIIEEELQILESMRGFFHSAEGHSERMLDDEMLWLRDSMAESSKDDQAQLMAQLISVSELAKQRVTPMESVQEGTPYFGHLRLKQEGRTRDVLIGNANLMRSEAPMPIVNWHSSPVSRVFYCYQEGDLFEESFGGRLVDGEVLVHRRLVIEGGLLLRVECLRGRFQFMDGCWRRVKEHPLSLTGGEYSALRPSKDKPSLGIQASVSGLSDRRLANITGLLDESQYELITDADSQVMVVDGGAGSGKTTVALHRLAFLSQHDPKRFVPRRMMVVVFSAAMASYIEHFLPALEVHKCRIEVYEKLVENLRKRHFPKLPAEYHSTTTGLVWRFKHSFVCQELLLRAASERAAEWEADLREALGEAPQTEILLEGWRRSSFEFIALRPRMFVRWLENKDPERPSPPELDYLSKQRLQKALQPFERLVTKPEHFVLDIWSESFLSHVKLTELLNKIAPDAYTPQQIRELHQKLFSGYSTLQDWLEWKSETPTDDQLSGSFKLGKGTAPIKPQFYREDDTILLSLYQSLVGPLQEHRQPLKLAHITIDEAQDFSPPELKMLLNIAEKPFSLTLAGDTEQRVILHQEPKGWIPMLREIGLENHANLRRLEVGYRGTEPIINFSRKILGHLHQGHPWRAIRGGPPVLLLQSKQTGFGPAISFIAPILKSLQQREPHATIALIAREEQEAQDYHQGLLNADVPKLRLVLDYNFSFQAGTDITTITQVKGLEFDYVLILNVNQQNWHDDDHSRFLLHVAATRAAHQLWLICCGTPSKLLPDNLHTYLF